MRRHRTVRAAAVRDGAVARLRRRAAVALVGADGARPAGAAERHGRRLALELAEDGLLVREEVADQAVAVALVHRERALHAGAQDARRQRLRQRRDVRLVGRRQVDQAREMGHERVERGDVVETELAEGALQHLDPSLLRRLVRGGRVDGLDDLVDLRRNNGICAISRRS